MNTGDTHDPNNSGGFGGPPMPPPGGTPPSGPGYPGPGYPGPGYPGQPPGAGFGGFAPAPPAPQGPPLGPPPTSFFSALFDYNFNSYVTPKVVKVVYILVTIALGLMVVVWTIAGFASESPAIGLVALLGGSLFFIVMLALARISLEFYVAVIKISEDVKEIKRR
ncbi:DUF4282 domain-containing protein [Rhodococcus sp. TAF43]|uniref:DUF4282 domain-containing protein n=1 Tax=unclassified Rhodococcus (in: high G+C Gram-positive bacteria) TaxID=192944 RepID=UPI001583D29E|nr:DUF4282 domain-containing protein [Rhodococcus sp. W8901]QKT09703.1 DUF4282 domain-containing protein [Rhodococcus sp. W8901]